MRIIQGEARGRKLVEPRDASVRPPLDRIRESIFSLLGGISYFGAIGLIAGPLVISFFLAVIRMWDRDQEVPASG